jgi:hypothetical protein
MWLWLPWTIILVPLILAGGWTLRDTARRNDLLRRHDPDLAAAVELLGDAWNPATLPMRDRAFDPPSDPPGYRTSF